MLQHTLVLFLALVLLALSTCSSGEHQAAFSLPHWDTQTLGRSASIRGLSAVDAHTAWLSGSKGTIARTTDGGASWQLLPAPAGDTLDFRDIEAFDGLRAVVMSAGPGALSRIYRTDDGGQSWKLVLQNRDESGFFNGLAFWDDRHGILTGDPVGGALFIALTDDGGRSWRRIPPDALPPVDSAEYGFAASGTHIGTLGDSLVLIGTGGGSARVFRSKDRGRFWSVHATPMISGEAATGIFSLAFLDDRQGIAVGGDYTRPDYRADNVMRTDDGGQSWQLIDGAPLPYRSCVRSVEDLLLAAGPTGTDISFDQGRSWQPIDTTGYHVLSAGDGRKAMWAAGPEGRVAKLVWE